MTTRPFEDIGFIGTWPAIVDFLARHFEFVSFFFLSSFSPPSKQILWQAGMMSCRLSFFFSSPHGRTYTHTHTRTIVAAASSSVSFNNNQNYFLPSHTHLVGTTSTILDKNSNTHNSRRNKNKDSCFALCASPPLLNLSSSTLLHCSVTHSLSAAKHQNDN